MTWMLCGRRWASWSRSPRHPPPAGSGPFLHDTGPRSFCHALCYKGAHMRGNMHCMQGSGMHDYQRAASLALVACLQRDCSA